MCPLCGDARKFLRLARGVAAAQRGSWAVTLSIAKRSEGKSKFDTHHERPLAAGRWPRSLEYEPLYAPLPLNDAEERSLLEDMAPETGALLSAELLFSTKWSAYVSAMR